jgi:hypothetical protein
MDSAEYSTKLLATVSGPPTNDPVVTIDRKISHNAAHCMTSVICNRLASPGVDPQLEGGTTYRWADGIINVRNAVKPFLWTNLRLTVAKDFHANAATLPAVYLMACWQPTDDKMHVWAIPERVMFDALPRHPEREMKEKRTIQIKTNVHRFEQCIDSPDLQPYHRSLILQPAELKVLKDAYDADSLVKLERKSGSSSEAAISA